MRGFLQLLFSTVTVCGVMLNAQAIKPVTLIRVSWFAPYYTALHAI